jgi:hypothetical protein
VRIAYGMLNIHKICYGWQVDWDSVYHPLYCLQSLELTDIFDSLDARASIEAVYPRVRVGVLYISHTKLKNVNDCCFACGYSCLMWNRRHGYSYGTAVFYSQCF